MNVFQASLVYVIKKPFLLLYMMAIALILAIIQFFNPINALLRSFGDVVSSTWGDTLIHLSKDVYRFSSFPYIMLAVLCLAVVFSVISSLLGSGYMNVLHLAVSNRKNGWNRFSEGIRKYFFRTLLVFFEFYVLLFLFLTLVPLSLVPSVVIANRAAENSNPNFINTGMIPAITGVIVFLILAFLLNWFIFRLPAIFLFQTKPIEKTKIVLSHFYWKSYGKNAAFLLVLVMGFYLINNIQFAFLEILAAFVFYSLFFYIYAVFTFHTFRDMVEQFKT